MRDTTRHDWHEKIEKAIAVIIESLDEPDHKPITLRYLSQINHTSPYHFHRMFHEFTGETVHHCLRRLRLERASYKLNNTYERITDIALDSGYDSLESFSKAFKSAYGLNPSEVRNFVNWNGLLYSKSGIHYKPATKPLWYYLNRRGGNDMETKIITLPEKRIVCVENIGDYWGLPIAWEKFHKILGENNLHQYGREWMSVFPDHDEKIPVEEKRSYAAMTVDKDFVNKYGLKEVIIPEGIYAIAVHFGDTEGIGPAWDKWLAEWLPHSGWEVDYSRPNLEWYQNRVCDPELTLTFMCTPVKKVEN